MRWYFKKSFVIGAVFSSVAVLNLYLLGCTREELTLGDIQLAREELQGGENGTINLASANAFAQPIPPMLTADVIDFKVGRSFFHTAWVIAPSSTKAVDGLGPLYNARSCNSCHVGDGRGLTPSSPEEQLSSVLIRISMPGQDSHGGPNPVPDLGLQLRNAAILTAKPDAQVYATYADKTVTYPDGSAATLRTPAYQFKNLRNNHPVNFLFSPRIAGQLAGMGLLEAIPEQTILSYADPHDSNNDGISGKANYVWNEEKQQTALGRFGWKANQPNIRQQVAAAYSGDIGITTPVFPQASLSGLQQTLYGKLPEGNNNGKPELPDPFFANTVFYTQALAVPQRRNWTDAAVQKGKALFFQLSCAKCHIPQLQTGNFADVPLLSNQTIHPYTDLLLHDMGDDLADGRNDFLATGNEWRTPPLWGIGLVRLVNNNKGMFLMHDGRARTIEEAVLWHGGEAEKSKEAFMKLAKTDREALIKFINDL